MRLALMGQKLGHKVFIVSSSSASSTCCSRWPTRWACSRPPASASSSRPRARAAGPRAAARSRSSGSSAARADEAARPAASGWAARTSSSWSTSISAARSPTSATSRPGWRRSAATTSSSAGMGFDITHVDVGGGLGRRLRRHALHPDGQRELHACRSTPTTSSTPSRTPAATEELPMPHIIRESGRALTAHHALLLVNVIDVESQIEPVAARARGEDPHPLLRRDGGEPARRCSAATRSRGGLPRRRRSPRSAPRSTSPAACFSLRDKARRRADLLRDDERARSRRSARIATAFPEIVAAPRRGAGGPLLLQLLASSSRCPTTGRSTSSSRSCRSTG